MITTLLELRQLIADNCDFSKPLCIAAHDVGKKAAKHSTIYTNESLPARLTVTPGQYSSKCVIELAHDADVEPLMPEAAIAAIDELLEEVPHAKLGWAYFFYFPMDYAGMFGKVRHIENSMLDTNEIEDIYLVDDMPNTLAIKAKYGVGSFDM